MSANIWAYMGTVIPLSAAYGLSVLLPACHREEPLFIRRPSTRCPIFPAHHEQELDSFPFGPFPQFFNTVSGVKK